MKVIASWQYCLIIPFLFLALLVKCKYKSKMKKWKLGVVGGFGVNGWREEDETTNEGNIRLLSRGEAAKFSISYKLEYQCCCSGKDPEYSDPHLWLTFGELCGSCDWNSCVFNPPSPLPPSGDKLIWGSLWEIFPDDAYWGVILHPPPLSLIVPKHSSIQFS